MSLGFIPVIYIQLDGGHVEICQDGGPIGLIELRSLKQHLN